MYVLTLSLTLAGCTHERNVISAERLTGGNVKRGEQLIYSYNCGACHMIPAVAEANGTLGPTLKGIADRVYVAGLLINTPENLSRWITQPDKIHAETAMPNLGVTKGQANDIAAYLYTLR